VEVCRLTDVINMLVERQLTVNHHTQALNAVGCLDVDTSRVDCVDAVSCTMSFTCAKYNCFSLLRIQEKSIEVQPLQ